MACALVRMGVETVRPVVNTLCFKARARRHVQEMKTVSHPSIWFLSAIISRRRVKIPSLSSDFHFSYGECNL